MLKSNAPSSELGTERQAESGAMCEDAHMQANDTRVLLKRKLEFSIASLASYTLAIVASLTNLTNKSQLNNEPRLEPVCWQCGTARNLLKVHTAQAAHFVCKSCGGEQ